MRPLALALLASMAAQAGAQSPSTSDPDIVITRLATLPGGMVRISAHPSNDDLYLLAVNGDLYRYSPPYSAGVLVASVAQHGLGVNVQGLALDDAGRVFLVGNDIASQTTTSRIRRGTPDGSGGFAWTTVAQLAGIPRPSLFEHELNGIVVNPAGTHLFVNRGARTDHGEVQNANGTAPGLRETALTSLILRIPIEAVDLLLPNDEAALRAGGYYFADGVRNAFDLAFDAAGRLYGTENSGDRDDGDELNWIREGLHYGFPWRMGPHDTPQQFPGYDPDADPLVNPSSIAYMAGLFHDDPTYPPPPAGVVFTEPVVNLGPDGDRYRDETTGTIMDASAAGGASHSLTPHRSPLGLTFDVTGSMPSDYAGDGFVMSWTAGTAASNDLLTPFNDPGEDLLHLNFVGPDSVTARRIAWGFSGPTDAALKGNRMYVIEIGGSTGLWRLHFTGTVAGQPGPERQVGLRVTPNPLGSAGTAVLDVPRAGEYDVRVLDLLGRTLLVLHEGYLAGGRRTFALDGERLPRGTYVVRVVGPEGSMARMVVRD
jgi:glucose/arabinose dehydrogenase